eukprot:TRINITY_DN348_c0_g1_i1.p1 TRINITY_DN348_c0_g1~~TRINITY_DN348_c0_g1_i1.p1  ORF type:complete len:797 (+),score=125.66 TRINITY_DN348_c0_g1_i1:191-2581(+)
MRSYVGRTALRGAQLLSSGSSRNAVLVGRTAVVSKSLCTNPSLQSDGTRRPEDLQQISANDKMQITPEVVAGSTTQDESVVQIISEEVSTPSALAEREEDNVTESLIEPVGGELTEPSEHSEAPEQEALSNSGSDSAAFAASLKSMLQKGAIRTALWHYAAAMKTPDRSQIDKEVMALMLPVLGRSGWAPSSLDTLSLAIERGYDLGAGLFNCGLHAVSRSGETKRMREIIAAMWTLSKESHPNATTFNYLIGAYMYRGYVDDAFNVLNEMKDHLIYPTFATYHALITGCLRRRDSQRAFSTLMAVEKQRFDISAMTLAQVLVSASNNDDFDNVRQLLTKFESALPRYAAEVHRIAEARNIYRLDKNTRTTKEERSALRGMPKLEIGALSAVLHCAFRGGLADVALKAWQIMENQYPEFQPPPSLWYCLIGSLSGSGDLSTSLDVVGVMREKGVPCSLRDLDMAIVRPLAADIRNVDAQYYRLVDRVEGTEHGVERHGEGLDESIKLAQEEPDALEASDTALTESDTVDVVEGEAAEQDQSEHALQMEIAEQSGHDPGMEATESVQAVPEGTELDEASREFIRTRLTPATVGIDELNCVLSACSAAQDLERAFQTYDEIGSRFNTERNIDTFNALLEGCVQTRHIRGGMRVLQEMETQGFILSGQTMHLAVRLMIRAGRTDTTLSMIEEAHRKGHEVLPSTYQMLVRHFLRSDNVKGAKKVMELGHEAGLSERALTGRLGYDSFDLLRGGAGRSRRSESFPSNRGMQDDQVARGSEGETVGDDALAEEHGEEVVKH